MPSQLSRKPKFFIGTAGWTIPRAEKKQFAENGTHLQRYAKVFPAVEINSSFYRPHQNKTYEKWAADVPRDFRFSVKMPKLITHQKRFKGVVKDLDAFCAEIAGLGKKLGCVLVQTPPTLAFDTQVLKQFFKILRTRVAVDIACEPRHASWFTSEAVDLLKNFNIARVAADPSRFEGAKHPAGEGSFCYYRLHGSPRIYYSNYSQASIEKLVHEMRQFSGAKRIWCFYDNTASGAATPNALKHLSTLESK